MVFHTPQRKVRVPKLRIENTDIDVVDEFNFLGIIVDKNLNWKSHISHVSKKISKTTGILCRLKRFLSLEVLLTLYNSLILPYLNYGILVWGHKSVKLETQQKKVIRIITNSNFNAHSQPLFKKCNILQATHLCALYELDFCFKLMHGLLPVYFNTFAPTRRSEIHGYSTRNSSAYLVHQVKHSFAKDCIYYRIPIILNTTSPSVIDKIQTHSRKGFKKYIKKYFINSYYDRCTVRNCYICCRA